MELPRDLPLPPAWAANLRAIVAAPVACLPARSLPHPGHPTIRAMWGARLIDTWDRMGEGLGWYVTLTPWAAWCLGAELEPVPPRQLGKAAELLGLDAAEDGPEAEGLERWVPAEAGRPPGGLVALAGAAGREPRTAARTLDLGGAKVAVPVAVIVAFRRPRARRTA